MIKMTSTSRSGADVDAGAAGDTSQEAYVVDCRKDDTASYAGGLIFMGLFMLFFWAAFVYVIVGAEWPSLRLTPAVFYFGAYAPAIMIIIALGVLMAFRRYRLRFEPVRKVLVVRTMGLWAEADAEFKYEELTASICKLRPLRRHHAKCDYGVVVHRRRRPAVIYRARELDEALVAAKSFEQQAGLTCNEALGDTVGDMGMRGFLAIRSSMRTSPPASTDQPAGVAISDGDGWHAHEAGLEFPRSERIVVAVLISILCLLMVAMTAAFFLVFDDTRGLALAYQLAVHSAVMGFMAYVGANGAERTLPGRSYTRLLHRAWLAFIFAPACVLVWDFVSRVVSWIGK